MKTLKFAIMLLTFASFTFIFSCANSGTKDEKQDSVIEEVKADTVKTVMLDEKTAKYVCPMKCEGSFSETAGKCPKCQMDLIENPNFGK